MYFCTFMCLQKKATTQQTVVEDDVDMSQDQSCNIFGNMQEELTEFGNLKLNTEDDSFVLMVFHHQYKNWNHNKT